MMYINYPSWIKPEIVPWLPIRWYGLMYIIAFAIAYYLFNYQVKKNKIETEKDETSNFIFWSIVGLILGARIFYALVYDTDGMFRSKPWLIFWPFRNGKFTGLGGMSYHGGVIGAIIGYIIYCKVKKKDILLWGDMLAASVPLGYTFGRIGNFINQELYGRITSSSIGMLFPNAQKLPVSKESVQIVADEVGISLEGLSFVNLPRFPSQLFEAFFEGIVLWAIIWFVLRKLKPLKGIIIAAYMIGYGFFRFFIEYMRQPDSGMDYPIRLGSKTDPNHVFKSFLNISTGQILCFIMIAGGILFIVILSVLNRKELNMEKNRKPIEKKDMRKLRKKIK